MAERDDHSYHNSSTSISYNVSMSDSNAEADSVGSRSPPDILAQIGDVLPYQFEPEYLAGQLEDIAVVDEIHERDGQGEDENRLLDLCWRTCGHCQLMPTVRESICCNEIVEVTAKLDEISMAEDSERQICITGTNTFQSVCLNRWVLQTAWFQYRIQYIQHYEGPEHKQNRHVAYRQLARWCWGFLDREVRVVLPACSVCCIRAHFSPPGNEDEVWNYQFSGFQDVNEL